MKHKEKDVATRIVGIVEIEFSVGVNTKAHFQAIEKVTKILKEENSP